MPRFNDNDLSERREAADKAKKAMLERFRAQPSKDDPAVVEQKAARLAASQARQSRVSAREAARRSEVERLAAETTAREEEAARLTLDQSERKAAELRAEGDRAVELLAGQKAARDSRYAARKARRR